MYSMQNRIRLLFKSLSDVSSRSMPLTANCTVLPSLKRRSYGLELLPEHWWGDADGICCLTPKRGRQDCCKSLLAERIVRLVGHPNTVNIWMKDDRRAKYIRRMMAEIEELRRNNYVYRFLCMARSNICWVSIASLPTSSKNSVPPFAFWKISFYGAANVPE